MPAPDPCILALEASGTLLSVAVRFAGQTGCLISYDTRHGHAKNIVPAALNALSATGCNFESVTHIAAGIGPGSFTGIRVALACAKGFCLAWGATGVGVSGLQALASDAAAKRHNAKGDNEDAPMLLTADTRRGQLYCQFFDATGVAAGSILEAEARALPALRPEAHRNQPLYVGGFDHARVASEFAAQSIRVIASEKMKILDADMIAADAERQIETGYLTALAPLYLAAAKLGPVRKEKISKPMAVLAEKDA